jgi:xanthine dehydrogenase D subunit
MSVSVTRARVPTRPVVQLTDPPVERPGRLGESTPRSDGIPKVKGEFLYSSDLWAEGMLWGATLRSPHASALIRSIDISRALAQPSVHAVLTHEDIPGRKLYGMEIPDQPVLAIDRVRYHGEAVALVAADHPETARRACDLIAVDYEPLPVLDDPEQALSPTSEALHPAGNILRHISLRHGEESPRADVVVCGEYEVGSQDQAFLGPESGLAVPDGQGGVDLYIATQWLHIDRDQVALSLSLAPERVRLIMSGVGGAFGGREDLSMQIHACLLALHTGRPVKIVYNRAESFVGHVHRHPCRMRYEHGATRDGRLVYVKARILLDGGAYASSSTAVCSNAACFACGPYRVPNAAVDAYVVYTNNPPCGAMRGFGAVQVAFGHESQMDRLASALGMDPVELRIRNALAVGERLPTGQVLRGPAPVAELLRRVRTMPLPPPAPEHGRDQRELPGGVANTTHGEDVRRGVGYAVGFKNVGFSEGFDDYSTARVTLELDEGGEPLARVHSAAAEVGQGIVTVQAQVARTELGVERVQVQTADTTIGSAGSSSASRQTYMTGGAVKMACENVRERLLQRAGSRCGRDPLELELREGWIRSGEGEALCAIAELLEEGPVSEQVEFHHTPTHPLDERGQGDAHLQLAFSAHRAVADVDVRLGLVRVVELATAQEVGRAINPIALEGQIDGGSAQGLGLALLEELQVREGKILNGSFTDYLLPTTLDMPPVRKEIIEQPDPDAPYGLKGVGEPPNISTPPAVVAALRAASGRALTRMPVRPEHLVGLSDDDGDSAPEQISAQAAGELSEEEFVRRFGAVCEHSPWVARAAWRRRPFASRAALVAAFTAALREAGGEQRLALVRAHPELGGDTPATQELTASSQREQAAAGLRALAPEARAELAQINRLYRERFGFPLVIAVGGLSAEQVLALARARLRATGAERELREAVEQVARIVEQRLQSLVRAD